MKIADKQYIREINEILVLDIIISSSMISRAEVSKVTGLNKATVSSIVKSLEEKELIYEEGIGDSNGGRRPVMYKFKAFAGLSLSIEIGFNYISSSLTYLDGTIIQSNTKKQMIHRETIIDSLIQIIEQYNQQAPQTRYHIIGLTIGIHGIVDEDNIIFTPYYDLSQLNILEQLKSKYPFPIRLENEANLSALGEKFLTSDYGNLISISVGSGIGAGIIIDNKLYKGYRGYSGEIGHTIVVPHGQECPCGNYGCLEQYASEENLLEEYKKFKGSDKTFEDLKNDYLHGDYEAIKIIDKFITFLSIGINNLINSFNPEVIIINSRFTNEIDDVLVKIEESLRSQMNDYLKIQASSLQEKATLLGGSYINSLQFLKVNHLSVKRESEEE